MRLVGVMILMALMLASCQEYLAEYSEVANFQLPQGGDRLVVVRENSWEIVCGYGFDVITASGRRGVSMIGYVDPSSTPPTFSALYSDDGKAIAVIEDSAPKVAVAIYDSERGESWPNARGGVGDGVDLLARLNFGEPGLVAKGSPLAYGIPQKLQ